MGLSLLDAVTQSKGWARLFLVGFADTEGVGFITFGEDTEGVGFADTEGVSFSPSVKKPKV